MRACSQWLLLLAALPLFTSGQRLAGNVNPKGVLAGNCTAARDCRSGLCFGNYCCASRVKSKESCEICDRHGDCQDCANGFKLGQEGWCEKLQHCTWSDVARYNTVARSLKSRTVAFVDLSQCNELVIKPNTINGADLNKLIQALNSANSTVKRLSIGRNQIGKRGIASIADAVASNTLLTDLELFTTVGSSIDSLVSGLEQNTNLKVLQLTNSNLDKDGIASLIALMGSGMGTQLKEVSLTAQGLGSPAADMIAKVLRKKACKITSLKLSHNHLDDNATSILAAALPDSDVTRLELDSNYIGDVGAKALAAAISHPDSKLQTLSLAKNAVNAIGASSLADALANSKLTELNLSSNRIPQTAAPSLTDSLQAASQVTRFNLRNNYIRAKTMRQIQKILDTRRSDSERRV